MGLCGASEPRNGASGAQKNELKPWVKQWWCIPPKANARFFWQMEDVPSISTRPYDVRFPQICIDESSKQLHGDKLEAVPMQPGQPEREDDAYEQREMCKMFLACEPLAGKRYVKVTRAADQPRLGALHLAQLVDVHYPKVETIVLVMDHLNTHTPALLYQTFTPAEARIKLKRLYPSIQTKRPSSPQERVANQL